jgi:hypothetical protein
MTGTRVRRAGAAFLLGAALLLQPAAGAYADGAARLDTSKMDPKLRARISGLADLVLTSEASQASSAGRPTNFFARADECGLRRGGNIKVNQNCLNVADPDLQGRSQAQNETAIAVDPNNDRHVLSSYNDYRRGDGTCGTSYSLDGGRSWNDSTTPNGFTRGNAGNIQDGSFGTPRIYWQGSGDTSVAWDTRGNAYLSCQVFNRGEPTSPNPDLSSAFVVFRSTQNDGASWDFTGRYVIAENDVAATGAVFEDKQYLTVDNHTGSPFRDRIYVTWTEFTATTGYIYESFSNDYGEHFSAKKLVSPAGVQPLCPVPITPGNGCDNNQFSQPFTAPDGTLYVVWANANTVAGRVIEDEHGDDPGVGDGAGDAGAARVSAAVTSIDNHSQILLARSTDGGNTFSVPVKVGDYFELPDCAEYQGGQDAGRSCVPEKGPSMTSVFRAANYPSGAVNPRNPRQVVVSYGSYINRNSKETNGCVPQGLSDFALPLYDGVKTAGACNNKIVVSVSNNAGASFTGSNADVRTLTVANQANNQRTTDQWFHWLAFTDRGKVAISYYDRAYGTTRPVASRTSASRAPTIRISPSSASAESPAPRCPRRRSSRMRRAAACSGATTPASRRRAKMPCRSGATRGYPTSSTAPAPPRQVCRRRCAARLSRMASWRTTRRSSWTSSTCQRVNATLTAHTSSVNTG